MTIEMMAKRMAEELEIECTVKANAVVFGFGIVFNDNGTWVLTLNDTTTPALAICVARIVEDIIEGGEIARSLVIAEDQHEEVESAVCEACNEYIN